MHLLACPGKGSPEDARRVSDGPRREDIAPTAAGPVGVIAIVALLWSTDCADALTPLSRCPVGRQVNFFGWDVFGLVGTIPNDQLATVGAVLAFLIGVIVWAVLS